MTAAAIVATILIALLAVLALIAGPLLLRRLVAVLPAGRRNALRRWLPAIQLGFVLIVIVLAAATMFGSTPALIAAGTAVLVVAGAAWFAVRDVIAGIVLRAEHDLQAGSTVRAGDSAGRVQHVGLRSVEIEATDGQRVRVPYTRLAASPVAVSRAREEGGALRFTVSLQRRAGGGRDDVARIRAAALHAFFASARRDPVIRLVHEDDRSRTYDVTVYAADVAFLQGIEEAVNDHLAG
jgi:small-conductance mechanosensitive channel